MTEREVVTAGGGQAKALSSPGHSSGFAKHVIIAQLTRFFSEDTERSERLAGAQSLPQTSFSALTASVTLP